MSTPSYHAFRSGLTFEAVRRELMGEQQAAAQDGRRMFVTRHTVLGRMKQYKEAAYKYAQQNPHHTPPLPWEMEHGHLFPKRHDDDDELPF